MSSEQAVLAKDSEHHNIFGQVGPDGGEVDDENDDDLHQKDEDDDDDEADLGNISLAEAIPAGFSLSRKEAVSDPERPPESLRWDDDAIQNCLDLAITTHDSLSASCTDCLDWPMPILGTSSDQETLKNWKPASLALPLWAVDPLSISRRR